NVLRFFIMYGILCVIVGSISIGSCPLSPQSPILLLVGGCVIAGSVAVIVIVKRFRESTCVFIMSHLVFIIWVIICAVLFLPLNPNFCDKTASDYCVR